MCQNTHHTNSSNTKNNHPYKIEHIKQQIKYQTTLKEKKIVHFLFIKHDIIITYKSGINRQQRSDHFHSHIILLLNINKIIILS